MSIRESLASWWLERRARTSPYPKVVYHTVSVLRSFNHPLASKAIRELLHGKEPQRLAAVISAVIDNAGGDPLEALHKYNQWALKDEKTWLAVLKSQPIGTPLVKRVLRHAEFFIHKAAVNAVLPTRSRMAIPDLLIGMARHSRYFVTGQDRFNNQRWDFTTIDAAMKMVAEDWAATREAAESVPELVAAFGSSFPQNHQATYVELLEKLDASWTSMINSRQCIPCLVAITDAPPSVFNEMPVRQMAKNALQRIIPPGPRGDHVHPA